MAQATRQFLLVALLLLSQYVIFAVSYKDQIKEGLNLGKEIANVLKSGEFKESLTKLAGAIGPFLGALGPLVSLIMAFIPGGESAELQFMKKEFENLNRRLDTFTEEFAEVKRMIQWNSVEISYAEQEKRIKAMQTQLRLVFTAAQGAARNNQIKYFIMKYESDFQNSGLKLYHGIAENSHIFTKNLMQASVKYTQNHRRRVRSFMQGLVQLLLVGIEVELAYFQMKGWKENMVPLQNQWKERIDTVRQRMNAVDDEVTGRWHNQAGIDTESFSASHHGLSNSDFDQRLYNLLADKYDWRFWFVLIYSDVSGGDNHFVSTCGGHIKFRSRGRNIVTASVDRRWSTFNAATARAALARVEARSFASHAEYMLKVWNQEVGGQCSPYAFVGFVCWGCDVWYIAYGSHREYRRMRARFGGSMNGLVFG